MNRIHPFLSIRNPLHPLFSKLENLTAQGREALLNGYRALGNKVMCFGWVANNKVGKRFHRSLKPIAEQQEVTRQAKSRSFRYSNLCLERAKERTTWSWKRVDLFIAVNIVFRLAESYTARTKQRKERQFVLAFYHELRTPITSLGLIMRCSEIVTTIFLMRPIRGSLAFNLRLSKAFSSPKTAKCI